ncbi:MAG: nicotinate-nucleotide adenylyltransferase [Bacteroidetes bacterium]|jgi:nicotinate-nucleotide adenylyltransferase|nr:MAG: nicotinate-nucleotide adenylyltransferase [Bacteroidota bacterium]
MTIGLYFGSFNPIHTGHLIIAQTALNEARLDYVWLIVSPHNPLKPKKNLLSEYDRFRMAELALEGNDRILASNVEFSLSKPSFTIDTLTHLRDTYRSYEFALIMGQDNLQQLPRWKNYEAILKYYPIHVYPRPGTAPSELDTHPNVHFFQAPLLDISATHIRDQIRAGKSVRYLVPEATWAYLDREGLYR